MKIQKKHVVIGIIALGVSLFAGFGLLAVRKGGKACTEAFPGDLHGRRFHHRYHDKDSLEHMLSFLDKRIAFLDLNENQEKKYEEIRGRIKDRLDQHMKDRKILLEQLQKEMHRETPDSHRIAGLITKHIRAVSGSAEEGVKYFAEFYDQLDEEQKKLILQRVRKRFEKERR